MKIIIKTVYEYSVTDEKKKELIEQVTKTLNGNIQYIKFKEW